MTSIRPHFSEESIRICTMLEDLHERMLDVQAALSALPYNMVWKRTSGREYLYRLTDRKGNGKSMGRRSTETAALFEEFHARRDPLQAEQTRLAAQIDEAARIYRALRLPMLDTESARVLRHLERYGVEHRVLGSTSVLGYAVATRSHLLPFAEEDLGKDLDLVLVRCTEPVPHLVPEGYAQSSGGYRSGTHAVDIMPPGEIASWLAAGGAISPVLVGKDMLTVRMRLSHPTKFAVHRKWSETAKPHRFGTSDNDLIRHLTGSSPPDWNEPEFSTGIPPTLRSAAQEIARMEQEQQT